MAEHSECRWVDLKVWQRAAGLVEMKVDLLVEHLDAKMALRWVVSRDGKLVDVKAWKLEINTVGLTVAKTVGQ